MNCIELLKKWRNQKLPRVLIIEFRNFKNDKTVNYS